MTKRRRPAAYTEADDGPAEVILGGHRAVAPSGDMLDARFWLVDPSGDPDRPANVHSKIYPWAVKLRAAWRRMQQADREHDIIYENRALRSGGRWHGAVRALSALRDFDASRLFVTTSIVDTVHARMVKRQIMPAFVVDDAEWSLKQKAHDYRAWLHGKLRADAAEQSADLIKRDAPVRGDGIEYIDDGDDDVIIERTHRDEWLADPAEAKYGWDALRTLYRFRTVSRDALIARFPKFRVEIEDAPAASSRSDELHTGDWLAMESDLGQRDVVDFIEAWHLPSGLDAAGKTTGRKAAIIDGVTLCYDEREDERFPIARFTWHPPMRGLWGHGDVERLRGMQAEINGICRDIAMNVAVTGKGIWITPPGIQPAQLTGYRPFHLEIPAGGGGRIEFYHPPVLAPSQLDYLRGQKAEMYNLVGAAQWFAEGRSPLGNDVSGVALDTMADNLSDRHAPRDRNVDRYVVARSQAILDAGRRVSKRLKDGEGRDGQKVRKMVPASWMDKGSLHRVEFDEVSLDADCYELGIEPISNIPTTRGGKLKWVSEMIGKGVIPSKYAASLYNEPDIEHITRIELATMHNVERMMEELGKPEKYPEPPTPEEWHDPELCVVYAKAYFNLAQTGRAPEEVQMRYREFGDAAIDLIKRSTPPAPGPMAAGGMPPGAPSGMPDPMAAPMPLDPMAGAPPMPLPPGAA